MTKGTWSHVLALAVARARIKALEQRLADLKHSGAVP